MQFDILSFCIYVGVSVFVVRVRTHFTHTTHCTRLDDLDVVLNVPEQNIPPSAVWIWCGYLIL